MKSKLQRLKEKLDRLIQEKYVPVNRFCFVCGSRTSEMHHYIQKKQSLKLRWDERNLIPLCKSCHCKHHIAGDPHINEVILRKKGFEWANELEEERRVFYKVNVKILEDLISRISTEDWDEM